MDKEALRAAARQQKEELAMAEASKRKADRAARKKCIAAVVGLCSQIMTQAAKRGVASRVVCFESSGTPSVMRHKDWKRVIAELGEIEYAAEFVYGTPDLMLSPSTGKFENYQKDYAVAGQEYFSDGGRRWMAGYRVERSFVKNGTGDTLAIKVSLI